MVEWSEQLRSVISVWLGAAAVGFEFDSAPAGEVRMIFGIVLIIIAIQLPAHQSAQRVTLCCNMLTTTR